MSSNIVGKILELFISIKGNSARTNKKTIQLDTNGVIEDKFHNKDIQRSVLITSTHSYKLAKENNINANYSDLGENILIDYNPYDLPIGTRLLIGSATLEITHHCTLCKSLAKVDKDLPKLLKNDRGVFAKVVKVGTVNKHDKVYLLK